MCFTVPPAESAAHSHIFPHAKQDKYLELPQAGKPSKQLGMRSKKEYEMMKTTIYHPQSQC